ncbi:septation protein A [Aquaspirillum serpens]|uniref:septation protein A n=1 Tax=Aquaspirillum serpens TaxID=190 RepID=UPI0003B44800|nr:septation protein A [Aquaspirillum serpens]
MKFLSDLFPVILFFAAFYLTRDMFIATGVAIVATCLQVGISWLRTRRVETMQWVSLALMLVLGGATLLLHNKAFIMWKPTVLYWLMGLGLAFAHWVLRRQPLRAMLGQHLNLPEPLWSRLTLAWVGFFLAMGGLNLFVAYQFSEEVWVNFKLFGGMGLMFAFVLAQGVVLARYMEDDKT